MAENEKKHAPKWLLSTRKLQPAKSLFANAKLVYVGSYLYMCNLTHKKNIILSIELRNRDHAGMVEFFH